MGDLVKCDRCHRRVPRINSHQTLFSCFCGDCWREMEYEKGKNGSKKPGCFASAGGLAFLALIIAFGVGYCSESCGSSSKKTNSSSTTASSQDLSGIEFLIATQNLNLRKGPSPESEILTVLKKGEKVQHIVGQDKGNWIMVRQKEFEGYASAEYLKKE